MNLKKDIENKDSILIKLKSKINSLEDTSKNLKNDLNIKTEQLKQNKNQVDNLKQTNDKLDKQFNTLKSNFGNEITNLKNKNKKMSTDSENKILQLKNDIAELKKTISVKNKTKDQACQTLVEDKVHIFKQTQTDSVVKENYDKNTQTDKIGRVHIAIQNNVEDTNEEETASSNYEKKSLCMACFNDHTVKFPLDWPSRQYYFS